MAPPFLDIISSPFQTDCSVLSFELIEGISSPYQIRLVCISKENISDLLQKSFLFRMGEEGSLHYVTGLVHNISKKEIYLDETFYRYELTLYPKLYNMGCAQHYAIYQKTTIKNILETLLTRHNVDYIFQGEQALSILKDTQETLTQYKESDLDFFHHLLKKAGLNYYFDYDPALQSERIVITPLKQPYKTCYEDLPLGHKESKNEFHILTSLNFRESHTARNIYATSYSPATAHLFPETKLDLGNGEDYQLYAMNQDTDQMAHSNLEKILWEKESIEGESSAYHLTPFQKVGIEGKEYTITAVHHVVTFEDGFSYNNTFKAHSSSKAIPAMLGDVPKRNIDSLHSAKVISDPDPLGRIKVQFFWTHDSDSCSAFIRIAHPLSGKGYGATFTPPIGSEVLVQFLDQSPDLPIIIGNVHNSQNLPSPHLYDGALYQGNRSLIHHKKGGADHALVMQDDDLSFLTNQSLKQNIEKDYKTVVKTGEHSINIEKGHSTQVLAKGNKKTSITQGDYTIQQKGDFKHVLKEGDLTIQQDKGNQSLLLEYGNYHLTLKKGEIHIESKGNITIQSHESLNLKGEKGVVIESNQGIQVQSKTGMNFDTEGSLTLDAAQSATLNTKGALEMSGLTSTVSGFTGLTLDGGQSIDLKGISIKANGTFGGTFNQFMKKGGV